MYNTATLEFDINGTKELDAPGIVAFADEINTLLKQSTLLLSTEGSSMPFEGVVLYYRSIHYTRCLLDYFLLATKL